MSVCICTPRQLNTGRRAKRCEAHTGWKRVPVPPSPNQSEERGRLAERMAIANWLSGACDNTFPPTLWSLLKQLGAMVARGDYRPVKSVKKKKGKRK